MAECRKVKEKIKRLLILILILIISDTKSIQ